MLHAFPTKFMSIVLKYLKFDITWLLFFFPISFGYLRLLNKNSTVVEFARKDLF